MISLCLGCMRPRCVLGFGFHVEDETEDCRKFLWGGVGSRTVIEHHLAAELPFIITSYQAESHHFLNLTTEMLSPGRSTRQYTSKLNKSSGNRLGPCSLWDLENLPSKLLVITTEQTIFRWFYNFIIFGRIYLLGAFCLSPSPSILRGSSSICASSLNMW